MSNSLSPVMADELIVEFAVQHHRQATPGTRRSKWRWRSCTTAEATINISGHVSCFVIAQNTNYYWMYGLARHLTMAYACVSCLIFKLTCQNPELDYSPCQQRIKQRHHPLRFNQSTCGHGANTFGEKKSAWQARLSTHENPVVPDNYLDT